VSGFDAHLNKKELRTLVIHKREIRRTSNLKIVPSVVFPVLGDVTRKGRGPKVLLVEDSDDNRAMMKRLLELDGYQVLEAVDGEQAVHIAEEERPRLILMDLNLPLVDGLTATRRIRQLDGLKDVPIVVVSACDTPAMVAGAFAAGCTEYMTKPIDVGLLEALCRDLAPPC
jgi:CheY-like chemotaxis protein